MNKCYLLLLFILLTGTFAFTQSSLRWAFHYGNPGNYTEGANDVVYDNAGNIYITGHFDDTLDFDSGPDSLFLYGDGDHSDGFLAKYDLNGNVVWAIPFISNASLGYNTGYAIALDDSGNVYVTGTFIGTVDFDPGADTANLTGSLLSVFVAKYAPAGTYQWAFKIEGHTGANIGRDIVVKNGFVYVAGQFSGTADFNPGSITNSMTSGSYSNAFLAKYTLNGSYVWAEEFGSDASFTSDVAYAVAVDDAENIYLSGTFQGSADFDPGGGTTILTHVNSIEDIFVLKLDSAYDFQWAYSFTGNGPGNDYALSIIAQNDIVTFMNYLARPGDIDPGPDSLIAGGSPVLQQFDASGNFINGRSISGGNYGILTIYNGKFYVTQASTIGIYDTMLADIMSIDIGGSAYSVALDGANDMYVVGNFTGTKDFDPDTTTFNLTSNGGPDIFMAAYRLQFVNASFTISADTICVDDPVFFSNNSSRANSYEWFINGMSASTDTNLTYRFDTSGNFEVSMVASDGVESDTFSVVIVVSAPSVLNRVATICEGDSFFVKGSYQYIGGLYEDTLTNSLGCDSILLTELIVIQPPHIDTIIGPLVVDSGSTEIYSVSASGNTAFNWTVTGGTKIENGVDHSIQVEWGEGPTGSVCVVEDSVGCVGEIACIDVMINQPTGINRYSGANQLFVYPNPVTNQLTLKIQNTTGFNTLDIKVIDMVGKTCIHRPLEFQRDNDRAMIDLSKLESGIYLITTTIGHDAYYKKIVKW